MSEQTASQDVPNRVECPAAKDPAVRLFILAAMLIGFGIWCFLDRGNYQWKPDGSINEKFGYILNHGGAIALPIVGLVPLVWGILFLRRRLVADQDGIGYAGGEKIPWDSVTSLDSSKLQDKGILYLRYGEGGRRRLVLDEWKLKNFRALVRLVESKVSRREEQ